MKICATWTFGHTKGHTVCISGDLKRCVLEQVFGTEVKTPESLLASQLKTEIFRLVWEKKKTQTSVNMRNAVKAVITE